MNTTANNARKTTHGRAHMRLQGRDIDVLSSLDDWGILGLAQLEGLVFRRAWPQERRLPLLFNNPARHHYDSYAYKRLKSLERARLIRTVNYLHLNKTYMLTHRGFDLLRHRGRSKMPGPRREVPASIVTHELTANAVGLTTAFLLGLQTTPERMLRKNRIGERDTPSRRHEHLPDLAVYPPEGLVTIEVELTIKSERRYRKLWDHYSRLLPDGGRVFYLVRGENEVATLLRLAGKTGRSFIYAETLERFQKDPANAAFANFRATYARLGRNSEVAHVAA